MHYVGVAHSTGREFDASWNHGEAFEFPLGGGRVIAGWIRAWSACGSAAGASSPSRRTSGTATRAPAAVIKPGETLVFVVDLLGVR